MTLHRALIHLDMIDLFKAKCQPSVTSAQVLVWLKTFPKLVELVSYFPKEGSIEDLRTKLNCRGKHGGRGNGRSKKGKQHLLRTNKRHSRSPAPVVLSSRVNYRTPKRITEEWDCQPGDDF